MPGEEMSHVLLVDDDSSMCELLEQGLTDPATAVESVHDSGAALDRIAAGDIDLVITDLRMPGLSGTELCQRIVQNAGPPVIVLTAFGDYETAVEAVRAGAYDFIAKPVRIEVLKIAVKRALAHARLHREVRRLKSSLDRGSTSSALLGESRAMQEVQDLIARAAPSASSVLVTGESGTGKELVAKALHDQSHLRGPFVAVNCAAIPEQLLESELFGHERGAYTDARGTRTGLFVQANGGTLFLDEIGELPLGLQPKLLRALQERTVRPLGGSRLVPFDARIIAATNRDLEFDVEEGRFRQDLYFRVNVIEIPVPSLRARGNDVLLLSMHFLRQCAERAHKAVTALTPEAANHFLRYPWPGNVRELSNVIERAVALTSHDHITVADLPRRVVEQERSASIIGSDPSELVPLEEMERRYILHVLSAAGGSRTAAAKILGLDRSTLWRRLDRYGVARSESKS